MKSVTVREVRQQFSRKVEAPLRRGETLILRKRKEVLGRIVPEAGRERVYPDFAARQEKIFGNEPPRLNVAEILREDRNRFSVTFDRDQAKLARAVGLRVLGS